MPLRTTLILLILAAIAMPALGAELLVRGTPGATLRVDGEVVGLLPLDDPLELSEGEHELQLSLRGYRTHRSDFELSDAEFRVMDLQLGALEPRTAAAASAVLAGLGQIYSGRPKTGAVFLGLQISAAVTAVLLENEYKQRREDYQRAHLAYSEAIEPEEIALLRPQVESAWNDLNDLEPIRDGFVYSIFAIALVSAAEAWWNFPHLEVDATPIEGGVQIGLGGSF